MLEFIKAGDVFEAWQYAYRCRVEEAARRGEILPPPATWNSLSPFETQTYLLMAEQMNRQLEETILLAVKRIVLHEERTSGYYPAIQPIAYPENGRDGRWPHS